MIRLFLCCAGGDHSAANICPSRRSHGMVDTRTSWRSTVSSIWPQERGELCSTCLHHFFPRTNLYIGDTEDFLKNSWRIVHSIVLPGLKFRLCRLTRQFGHISCLIDTARSLDLRLFDFLHHLHVTRTMLQLIFFNAWRKFLSLV